MCLNPTSSVNSTLSSYPLRLVDARGKLRGFYGPGEGPIYLDNVMCNGDEEHLIDCPSVGVGSFCFHFEDAGVMCQGTYVHTH